MNKTPSAWWKAALLALAGAIGCGQQAAAPAAPKRVATPIDPATTGEIAGEVTYKGAPPAVKYYKMTGTPECHAAHKDPVPTEDLVVKDGKLRWAFVYVKDGLGKYVFAVPEQPVKLDQVGCIFVPHVAGVQVGQPMLLVNSDPTLHNLHTLPTVNESWNIGFPFKGVTQQRAVEKAEVMIEYKCDVHGWMKGFIGAVDHPFFQVTGEDGKFTLKGVPAGEYTVECWQETLGTKSAKVKVEAKKTAAVSFEYEGK